MKRTGVIFGAFVFQLGFLCTAYPQKKQQIIFFYKPYTDSSENNLYIKTSAKFNFKIQYENLKNAQIENDLNMAIKHNDYRFISISGNSYLYPGLEGGYVQNANGTKSFISSKLYQKLVKKYKFKVIKGTSDSFNESGPPLQSVAYDYAKKYNKLLLLKIKTMKSKIE